MDRLVTVKFFRILSGQGSKKPFLNILIELSKASAASKRKTMYGLNLWCDKITAKGTMISGRFCREQTENLPPKVGQTGELESLGIKCLGQTVVWRYDAAYSVIAIEVARNGLTLPVFLAYVRDVCACRGYTFLPVTGSDNLSRMRDGRVREISVRLATPKNLETISPKQVATKTGMDQLMASGIAAAVRSAHDS